MATFSPCAPRPFSLQNGAFSEEFPQSRPCTTRIWACTTGWRPALYLCSPSPALGLRVVTYLVNDRILDFFLLPEIVQFSPRFGAISLLTLRKRPPPTGVKIAKIGKRGFRGQETPISQRPRNGRFESKNPHVSTGLHKENGHFLTQSAHFWDTGKWEFFDPETLFSRILAILTPVGGGRFRNTNQPTWRKGKKSTGEGLKFQWRQRIEMAFIVPCRGIVVEHVLS